MRSIASLRSRIVCAMALSAVALVAAAPVANADTSKTTPKKYYLALGDSLAFGYQGYKLVPPFAPSQFTTGYVDRFEERLKTIKPDIVTINKGCPGATSGELNTQVGCTTYPFALHSPYAGGKSQLQDALDFISANKKAVTPITVNIGANDVLRVVQACGGPTNPALLVCVGAQAPALFNSVAANLNSTLAQLNAAAPGANIVVLGLYNPYEAAGLGAANGLTQQLNATMAAVAGANGEQFADPFPAFNGTGPQPQTICSLTLMCADLTPPAGPDGDVHATDAGYRIMGDLVWDASGYGSL